jgi:hypothetical protein
MHNKHDLLNGRIYLLNGSFLAVNGKKGGFYDKILFFKSTAYSTVISSINTHESPPAPKCHAGNFP